MDKSDSAILMALAGSMALVIFMLTDWIPLLYAGAFLFGFALSTSLIEGLANEDKESE